MAPNWGCFADLTRLPAELSFTGCGAEGSRRGGGGAGGEPSGRGGAPPVGRGGGGGGAWERSGRGGEGGREEPRRRSRSVVSDTSWHCDVAAQSASAFRFSLSPRPLPLSPTWVRRAAIGRRRSRPPGFCSPSPPPRFARALRRRRGPRAPALPHSAAAIAGGSARRHRPRSPQGAPPHDRGPPPPPPGSGSGSMACGVTAMPAGRS